MEATTDDVMRLVIEPLRLHYRPRWDVSREPIRAGELEAAMVADVLSRRYSTDELAAGMAQFRRDWRMARWPVTGELLEALERTTSPGPRATLTHGTKPEPTSWAETVMTMAEGQEALAKGFGRELWMWARAHPGLVPGPTAMDACAAAEAEFMATLRRLISEARAMRAAIGGGPAAASGMGQRLMAVTLTVGHSMVALEARLRTRYLAPERMP